MTNLVSVPFSTSSQNDPMCMPPQLNLELTFAVPLPVWRLPLSGVVVTQWFGSLVHGVDLDKLPLMCLCFRILHCEGEMTPLTACFPEVLWWTANTIIVEEHFTWGGAKKKKRKKRSKEFHRKVIWPSPWHYVMVQKSWLLLFENIYLEKVLTCLNNQWFTV